MEIKNEGDYARASERADQLEGTQIQTEQLELTELLKAMKAYEQDFIKMLKEYT